MNTLTFKNQLKPYLTFTNYFMTQFSIIVPTYNSGRKIQQTIESVLNQNTGDWELIIINDGSLDNTESFILPFLKDSRIHYYSQDNFGVSHARNVGINKAKGQYIVFLDGDDLLDPNLLKEIIGCNFINYDVITWSMKKVLNGEQFVIAPIKQSSLYNHFTANFLAGSICYKKSVLEQVGMYDRNISFGENYELALRVCQIKDLKIKLIPEVLSTYLQGTKERKSNTVEKQLKSLIYSFKKHNALYRDNTKELSKVYYFFGYLLEKMSRNKLSTKFYFASWKCAPYNIKAFIKFMYLKFIK